MTARSMGKADGLSPLVVGCIIVNACMGAGFLTLPYAFARAGLLAGAVTVAALTVLAVLSAAYVVDTMHACGKRTAASGLLQTMPDFSSMVAAAYGDRAQGWSRVFLSVTLEMFLWTYASLVSSTFASRLPLAGEACNIYVDGHECQQNYRAWLGVFGCVVVVTSYLELREQVWFQLLLTGARAVVVTLLVGDSVRLLAFGLPRPHPGKGDPGMPPPAAGFGIEGVGDVVTVTIFALAVHFVLPETLRELAEPSMAFRTSFGAIAVCGLVYVLVGVTVAAAFGRWTVPVCTLNWANSELHFWRDVLSFLPVVDVAATYPIIATCVAANLAPGERSTQTVYRVAAAALPIVGAFVVYDVSVTVWWAGLASLFLCLGLPGLLWLRLEAPATYAPKSRLLAYASVAAACGLMAFAAIDKLAEGGRRSRGH